MATDSATDNSEELHELQVPPVGFQRMLSWQLSQVQDHLENSISSRKKAKRAAKKKRNVSQTEEEKLSSIAPAVERGGGEEEDQWLGYLVTNSDGEEEIYYSAPESPVASDEEETGDGVVLKLNDSDDPVELPAQDTSHSKLPRKKKKKRRKIDRMSRLDFFQPLCDLMDDSDQSFDVESMELTNYSSVLSLSEICLRAIKSIPLDQMEFQLPFLITSLVGNDKQVSSAVASQVQWLEKLLGEIERAIIVLEKSSANKKSYIDKFKAEESKCLYKLMPAWKYEFKPVALDDFNAYEGYHCPLPASYQSLDFVQDGFRSYISEYTERGSLLRYLLHYCNYFYPVTLTDASSDKRPSPAIDTMQRIAVERVNYWIKSRYSKISLIYSKFFNLWPAYVHWARGNLLLAAKVFASELESFEGSDQVVIFNEMARMFTYYGDRRSAYASFVKSSELKIDLKKDTPSNTNYDPILMHACNKAMQAGVWDTGLLDDISAGEAKSSWSWFLRECSEMSGYPDRIWFLHVAAIESRLRVHAGRYVPDSTPSTEHRIVSLSPAKQWLEDCEKLIMSFNLLDEFPVLYYHLSLTYALLGMVEQSRKAFDAFNNRFAGFHEWGQDGLPGQLSQPPGLPQRSYTHPWQNLFDLTNSSSAPIMRLHWRVQLLYPMQPYVTTGYYSNIADHAPYQSGLNLRLTADGDLTGDISMDLPPMRAVHFNPYNGSLLFKRVSSHEHYFLNKDSLSPQTKQHLPWPLRVYESSSCVVELCMAHRTVVVDPQTFCCMIVRNTNYMAVLNWYGTDGTRHKVDLRKLIRREYRQAMLETFQRRIDSPLNMETATEYIDKQMELGLALSLYELNKCKAPPKQSSLSHLNSSVQFQLNLLSHVVFGKGTVMLTFDLEGKRDEAVNVIVFINCTSLESFLHPKIHCSAEYDGFRRVAPDFESSLLYEKKHLVHLRYALAWKIERVRIANKAGSKEFCLFFNEEGDIVSQWHSPDSLYCTVALGSRIFNLDECIVSYSMRGDNKSHRSYPIHLTERAIVSGVPGMLLVHCQDGLMVLHPGTLERLTINGLRDTDGIDPPQDGFIYPQLFAVNGRVAVLSVYDICITDEPDLELLSLAVSDDEEKQQEEEEGEGLLLPDDVTDYGSCRVALAVNDRLVILHCSPRTTQVSIEFDVSLPGCPKDFHMIPGLGYLVCATQFPDGFRMDLYWLSPTGSLLGVLPCLGEAPHSFYSVSLPPCSAVADTSQESGGVHVYFDDGLGGICCLRPKDIVN